MTQVIPLLAAAAITFGSMAQGNSKGKGHGNGKGKVDKIKKGNADENDDNERWQGDQNAAGKYSKNQPAKVRAAFQQDYPNASNVVWTKYRGDWTATFNNGLIRPTAVYHANGQRKDTRTVINRSQLPGTIWDRIFKRDRINPVGNIVQIQSPSLGSEIFRIASQVAGSQLQYLFYNQNGQQLQYDY